MNELEKIKEEFKRIKEKGYVKASKRGLSGISKTFENLLKEENHGIQPKYPGIEIKMKQTYKKNYIVLFNASPSGKDEIARLTKKFGYPDEVLKSRKILNASVQANTATFVAGRFLFRLSVNYEKERISLIIMDRDYNIIDKKAYWDFKLIKERLSRKSNYMIYVKNWTKTIDGIDYHKYYDIHFYQLKSFEEFLKLIEDGVIRITFKVQIYRTGKHIGELHDLGTSFEIQDIEKEKLYKKINI